MKYLQYTLFLFLAIDYSLAHVDELYSTATANEQFFVYDMANFGRIILLVGQLFYFAVCCKVHGNLIKINWITIFVYLAYWTFALYEFKLWLDIQHSFINGQGT